MVHAALEQLYGLPAGDRVPDTALALVDPAWERVVADHPDLVDGMAPDQRAALLGEARALLAGYYRLEDPTRFDPQSCEQRIEVELADGTLLRFRRPHRRRGHRRAAGGRLQDRPRPCRGPALAEYKALFQMKFYAVALLRSRDVLATRLRLIYLADGQLLDYTPTSTSCCASRRP